MFKNIFYCITFPDRDECLLGISSNADVHVEHYDDEGELIDTLTQSIFSIGLLFLRIDIIY